MYQSVILISSSDCGTNRVAYRRLTVYLYCGVLMDSAVEGSHDWMRIRELAQKAGVSRYTIHYYYREGLLPPPLKTGRTMALYTNAHLECLRFIRKLRE